MLVSYPLLIKKQETLRIICGIMWMYPTLWYIDFFQSKLKLITVLIGTKISEWIHLQAFCLLFAPTNHNLDLKKGKQIFFIIFFSETSKPIITHNDQFFFLFLGGPLSKFKWAGLQINWPPQWEHGKIYFNISFSESHMKMGI